MANKFDIPITATDKTAAGIRSVQKRFEGLGKPIGALEKATKGFADRSAIGGLIGNFTGFNKTLRDTLGGLAEGAEGFGILGGAAGAATVGIGVAAVALGVAADKAIKFSAPIAANAAALGRMAQTLGVSTRELQLWDGAAQQNGDSAQAMNDALNSVGVTLNDARFGRNNQALALLNQLGVQIPITRDGTVDVTQAMLLLSDAMKRNNPQTQQTIAGLFGLNGVLNTVRNGSAALQTQFKTTSDTGVVQTDAQIRQSTEYNGKIIVLKQTWQAFKQDLAENVTIPWTEPLLDALSHAVAFMDRLVGGKAKLDEKKFTPASGAAAAGFAPATGARAQVEAFFKAHGWTAAQARGMAAGMQAENGSFNPAARNATSGAYGLGQLLGDRQRGLFAKYGPNPTADQQLQFLQDELTGTERRAGGAIGSQTTAEGAMQAYLSQFMRPGSGLAGDVQRGELALNGPGAAAAPSGAYAVQDVVNDNKPQAAPVGGEAPVMTLPSDAVAAANPVDINGAVHVAITLRGAPAGTVVDSSASGPVRVSAGIEHSMASGI